MWKIHSTYFTGVLENCSIVNKWKGFYYQQASETQSSHFSSLGDICPACGLLTWRTDRITWARSHVTIHGSPRMSWHFLDFTYKRQFPVYIMGYICNFNTEINDWRCLKCNFWMHCHDWYLCLNHCETRTIIKEDLSAFLTLNPGSCRSSTSPAFRSDGAVVLTSQISVQKKSQASLHFHCHQ